MAVKLLEPLTCTASGSGLLLRMAVLGNQQATFLCSASLLYSQHSSVWEPNLDGSTGEFARLKETACVSDNAC